MRPVLAGSAPGSPMLRMQLEPKGGFDIHCTVYPCGFVAHAAHHFEAYQALVDHLIAEHMVPEKGAQS